MCHTSPCTCSCTATQPDEQTTSTADQEHGEEDPDYRPTQRCSKDPKPPDITLTLPRKGLIKGTAVLATRCKVSHRVTTAITANLVKMGGGDLSECSLSTSTSVRHRSSMLKDSEGLIKRDFVSNMPRFLVVHWDGKVIKYEKKKNR